MFQEHELLLPRERFRLEEANLPPDLARSLAGTAVEIRVKPEEAAGAQLVKRDDWPLLVDHQGNYWNDWRPPRVFFTDQQGREWRLPRRWLPDWPASSEQLLGAFGEVSSQVVFREALNPPTTWDLWEINVPRDEVWPAYSPGSPGFEVEVRLSPGEPAEVFWRSHGGTVWRIPHDWRKRRVRLPGFSVLISQGVSDDVAEEYAEKIVGVNYHPGSLCCLPDQYRFRDALQGRWPVRIRDCTLVGLGDGIEGIA